MLGFDQGGGSGFPQTAGGVLAQRAGDAYVHAAVLAESRPRVRRTGYVPAGRPWVAIRRAANDEDPLVAVSPPVRMIQDIQQATSRSMEQVLRPDARAPPLAGCGVRLFRSAC